MANKTVAPTRRRPVAFSRIEELAHEIAAHGNRIGSLGWNIERLAGDDNPEIEKLEVARAVFSKTLARRLVLLVGAATRLNALLEDGPPLSAKDEAWLRRQMAGLSEQA